MSYYTFKVIFYFNKSKAFSYVSTSLFIDIYIKFR